MNLPNSLKTHTPLDPLVGGLKPGTLTLIHGVSGAGKTTLLLYLALKTAEAGVRTIYVDAGGEVSLSTIHPNIKILRIPNLSMNSQTSFISNLSEDVEAMDEPPIVIFDSIMHNYSLEAARLMEEYGGAGLEAFKQTYVKQLLYELEVQMRMLRDIARSSGGFTIASAIFKPRTASRFKPDYEIRLIHSLPRDAERWLVVEEPQELRYKTIRYVMEESNGDVLLRQVGEAFNIDEEVLRELDTLLLMDEWIGVIIG